MKSIKELAEEYINACKSVEYLEQLRSAAKDPTDTLDAQLTKTRMRKVEIMEEIERLRRSGHAGVCYATRGTLAEPTSLEDIEILRRKADYYRICRRFADKATAEGRIQDAEKFRQRAEETRVAMEEIRKRSTRTISTPGNEAKLRASVKH